MLEPGPEWIGIPYQPRGRSLAGADCYGLAFLYLKSLGYSIPDYDIGPGPAAAVFSKKAVESDAWIRVDEDPQPGDVVLFRDGPWPTHCGVFLGSGRVLQSEPGTESAIVRIGGIRWKNRIWGTFRSTRPPSPS